VEKRYGGTIFVQIARPKSRSIRARLRERKKEHPDGSVGDLTKLIELESQAGDQRRFPGLVGLANEFERIRFSPILSDEIIMDATEYTFRTRSLSGEQMELILHGPGPSAPAQPHALIQWAESAKAMLASTFK
jgi:hypothetical protein